MDDTKVLPWGRSHAGREKQKEKHPSESLVIMNIHIPLPMQRATSLASTPHIPSVKM